MTDLFAEMDKIVFHGSKLHCYFLGNCTAYRSPGKFALVKDQAGNTAFHAEGATSEEALRKLIDKIRAASETPKPAGMPMPAKMPGML